MHDSLRRNSILLTLGQAVSAGSGFIFWLICARLFATEEVGLAAAFIAYGVMFSAFTNLGISNTVIRFMPKSRNKLGLINATLLVTSVASIIGSVVSVLLVSRIAPDLTFITGTVFGLFATMSIILFSTLNNITDSILISTKSGGLVISKATVISIGKLLLVVIFTGFGVTGILAPHIIALSLGIGFGLWSAYRIAHKQGRRIPTIDIAQLYEHRSFAAGNFFGNIVGVLPSSLLPIIVLNQLGAEHAAYFFVAFQLAAFLNLISSSATQAIFAESSHSSNDDEITGHLKKGFVSLYQLLIPAILILSVGGGFVLSIYGSDYFAHAYQLLLILLISSIFVGINWLGDTWLNIQKKMKIFFTMNLINAVLVILLVYIFADKGLVGVGTGWIAAQALSATIYIVIFLSVMAKPRS